MSTVPAEVEQYRKAQEAEWGLYVASQPIDVNGVRAFNVGDPVPASHVDGGIVPSDKVAKTTTKAGREVVESVTAETPKG